MFPLFESVCVKDGEIKHAHWHQARYESSFIDYYGSASKSSLFNFIKIPNRAKKGTFKLRISYNQQSRKIEFIPYEMKSIASLRMVNGNDLDYSLKYSNREKLLELHDKKDGCDDVLIVKEGLVTDSSYANIVFFNGENWLTPASPLLKGTARARLLKKSVILEAKIKSSELQKFESWKLINAMRDFDDTEPQKIQSIKE